LWPSQLTWSFETDCPDIQDNEDNGRMDRILAIQAFVRVVEAGSFARAAQRLRSSTSSISRQIAALEQHLGARLLNRTTRKLSLTEGGQAFYERSVQLLAELEEAEQLVGAVAATPRGTIRLTCPRNLAARQVGPVIARFAARHPSVRFDVTVSDALVDLVEEGFDLAIRIGRVGAEGLVARRLGQVRLTLAAAPSYLRAMGTPRAPSDLAGHRALTYAYAATPNLWRLMGPDGTWHDVRVSGPLIANNDELLMASATAGLGLVMAPQFMLETELAAHHLVRVLPGYEGPLLDTWAVYPSRRHLSAKVRLFVDHLVESFSREEGQAAAVRGVAPGAGRPPRSLSTRPARGAR
jgi:DNA-binding transcriptional LysR family regulator